MVDEFSKNEAIQTIKKLKSPLPISGTPKQEI
jgi:hypothetical protein